MTSQLPPRETDHYTQLTDAAVVTTRPLLAARENITDTIDARAMMCLHGPAGVGKTLAVNVCLRELERTRGERVCRIAFRARPTARAVRHELFAALGLPGEPPRHPSEFDRLLLDSLGWSWTKLNGLIERRSNTFGTSGITRTRRSLSSSPVAREHTRCCGRSRCSPPASSSGSTSPSSL
ncbi:AAA family ATPase [Streptomyces jumonjinensis]|uniref:AAA family ATPase n=1 Tax=Streptomyces jumonjinensis TaxID=1945 RepID=UPI0037AA1476